MKLILRYLKPLAGTMAFGLSVKVFATLMELSLPYILSYILDSVVPIGQVAPILIWGGAMVFAALMAMLGNVIANRNAAKVAKIAARQICLTPRCTSPPGRWTRLPYRRWNPA